MKISFNQVVHELVGMIKYAVALLILVAAAKLYPMLWGNICYVDPEDLGMREALGKTTMKVAFDPNAWGEDDLERGQIVILSQSYSKEGGDARKNYPFRIVAVAGDSIEAARGAFKINGEPEKYSGTALRPNEATNIPRTMIPRGHIYVLPDDRIDNRGGLPELVPVWRVLGRVAR